MRSKTESEYGNSSRLKEIANHKLNNGKKIQVAQALSKHTEWRNLIDTKFWDSNGRLASASSSKQLVIAWH